MRQGVGDAENIKRDSLASTLEFAVDARRGIFLVHPDSGPVAPAGEALDRRTLTIRYGNGLIGQLFVGPERGSPDVEFHGRVAGFVCGA